MPEQEQTPQVQTTQLQVPPIKRKPGRPRTEKSLEVRKPTDVFDIGSEKANKIIQSIVESFVEGVDFGTIPGCRKPSLYKPGAEKPCLRFNLDAQFFRDNETLEMLPGVTNLVAYKCILIDRTTGKRVGEGRGSAVLGSKPSCKDANGTIKMAQKSAQIDAALRTFALSERFTQDMEDVQIKANSAPGTGALEQTITIGSDGSVETL